MTDRALAYLTRFVILILTSVDRSRARTRDFTVVGHEDKSDVFISYRRTRFGEQVRRVAELLISQGVHVWLDDYSLFAINVQEENALDRAISTGITLADQAVVFLTPDYPQSQWCVREKSELETRFHASPEAILTLDERALGDEGAAARMIIQKLGLAVSPPPAVVGGTSQPVEQNWLRDEGAGYQFDATGWDVRTRGGYFRLGDYQGPILARRGDPHRRSLSIITGPAMNPGFATSSWEKIPKDGRLAIIRRALWDLFEGTPPDDKSVSEKDLWNEGYRFGTRYVAGLRTHSLHGTHIFLMDGNYHFALTYLLTYLGKPRWIRRYSIIATDHLTNLHIEVTIAIGFSGAFTEFCAVAQEFDALVHTFSRFGVGASHSPVVRPGSGS